MRHDRFVTYVFTASAALVVLVIGAIVVFVARQGLATFAAVSPFQFFFSTRWEPWQDQFGAFSFIFGSLAVTVLAILFGGPVGLATAVFMARVAPVRVRALMRQAVDLFVGIPSVVYGWLGLTLLVPFISAYLNAGGGGFGILAAALILAVMILPTVVSLTEDALRSLPQTLEEGSLALGATRWQTIWHVLLPAASPTVVAAFILAMGRAVGETMAVQMVIGNAPILPSGPAAPTATMTSEIVTEMGNTPYGSTWNNALFALALVLLLASLAAIVTIRLVASRRQAIKS